MIHCWNLRYLSIQSKFGSAAVRNCFVLQSVWRCQINHMFYKADLHIVLKHPLKRYSGQNRKARINLLPDVGAVRPWICLPFHYLSMKPI